MGWMKLLKATGFFKCISAISRSRFSFQLYLGWMMILSSKTIFSWFRSYLHSSQRKEKSDAPGVAQDDLCPPPRNPLSPYNGKRIPGRTAKRQPDLPLIRSLGNSRAAASSIGAHLQRKAHDTSQILRGFSGY